MSIVKSLLSGILFIALYSIMLLWFGFSGATLWNWFLVPLGLPTMTVLWMIGILFALSVIDMNHPWLSVQFTCEEDDEFRTKAFIILMLNPGLALLFGWIVKMLMGA